MTAYFLLRATSFIGAVKISTEERISTTANKLRRKTNGLNNQEKAR